MPLPVAIIAALATGAFVGFVYAIFYTRLGMPSFVATLAGLLALLGLQLYLLGATGSINLPFQSDLVRFGQTMIMPDWLSYLLAILPGAVIAITGWRTSQRRVAAGLSPLAMQIVFAKAIILTLALGFAVWYLSLGRGLPWMFALFVLIAVALNYGLTRTQWGRSMFAVGGNREAARRAGINVNRIYTSAFILCSTLAAAGGILGASRLASSSQQAGTGDVNLNAIAAAVIGGTSLFGGRGSIAGTLIGALIVGVFRNGLALAGVDVLWQEFAVGLLIIVAVAIDNWIRKASA
jgi:D-xylose transport system permease protein